MKTRSGNATARALKVPSSEAQAVECAGEGRERGARRRWQKGRREPKPAVTSGARGRCSGAGASDTPPQLAAKIVLHRAMVRCGRAHASTRTKKCRGRP